MTNNRSISFKVNTSIYPLSAILTAAYVFLEKAYVHLDKSGKDDILVQLESKNGSSTREIKGSFQNELLNCALRENIAKENVKIREYIIGQALYSSVQDAALSAGKTEVFDDPLGIAVPWEEKYGKKAAKKVKSKK